MGAIRYYTDTKIEYEIAKMRLNTLLNKKEEIYIKYFGIKSPSKFSEVPLSHSYEDKMVEYLNEVEIEKRNGLTLQEEIESIKKEIARLEAVLKEMEIRLAKLNGIEDKLYYEIVVNKKKVTEAVEYIAETCYTSDKNVWKTYYPKIKDDIRKLRKYNEVE